jgi:multidrug transporter EmrE-like cation transporter
MLDLSSFNTTSLGYGGALALGDSIVLSTIKAYSEKMITWRGIVPLVMLYYSLQPFIFLKSMAHESLTVMNLLWDVMSDVSVTIIGLFFFKEKLTKFKKIGVLLSVISIILLSWKDGDD